MRTKYSFKMQSPEFLDRINYKALFLVLEDMMKFVFKLT